MTHSDPATAWRLVAEARRNARQHRHVAARRSYEHAIDRFRAIDDRFSVAALSLELASAISDEDSDAALWLIMQAVEAVVGAGGGYATIEAAIPLQERILARIDDESAAAVRAETDALLTDYGTENPRSPAGSSG
ncbi:hypothetical protein N1031_12210 [Herbiconiux moechotypicola]|uniref:hypothetical protein n=1 Tax=Herbiconiux moechotypicola TaxID=637393 RepID=UPI00217EBADD|nr:hypothetical protein [Herbiconiux moechotypicola]MCS5730527.1 hypothetical protein [Herbiconiux moechotypicola]